VAPVRTDVLDECVASIIRVKRISELGTASAITSNEACCERIATMKTQILIMLSLFMIITAFFIMSSTTAGQAQQLIKLVNCSNVAPPQMLTEFFLNQNSIYMNTQITEHNIPPPP
jgi:hypothetical protein